MASLAPTESASSWKRLSAWLTAFAEAAEMDTASFTEQRIQRLERRIADLEHARAAGLAAGGEA